MPWYCWVAIFFVVAILIGIIHGVLSWYLELIVSINWKLDKIREALKDGDSKREG